MNYHVDHVHTLSRAMQLGAFSVIIVLSLKTSKDDVIHQITFMNTNKPLIVIIYVLHLQLVSISVSPSFLPVSNNIT